MNGSTIPSKPVPPADVILLVRESQLLNPITSMQLANMVGNCTECGIGVWAWFLYAPENGYYPSWEDAGYLPAFKLILDGWILNNSLSIKGIIFDNELDSYYTSLDLTRPFSVLREIMHHKNTVEQNWSEVVNAYSSVMQEWKDAGYEIEVVGSELTLSDLGDGDADLQQMVGIVNYPPSSWDKVSIMMYRSCEYHAFPFTRDYLYSLARYHVSRFASRAVAAIGCMGYTGYDTTNGILMDIAMLKYLGYQYIELFEFRAFFSNFQLPGLERVMNASAEGWVFPEFEVDLGLPTFAINFALSLFDILLDFF
ncbi:MAG: hypothetical protein ACTSU9_10990 [Promethearchaeota archaeon]